LGRLKEAPSSAFLNLLSLKRRWWLIMKMIILVIIVVVVFSVLGLWLITYGNATSEERNMNYGISLTTDKMSYSIGEPIKMILKIFNYTEEEITFHFNTGQRYDFIIEDEEGNEIWRWSKDRMFAMVLGEEVLGQHNPEVIYTEKYKGKFGPGYYKITGVFIAQDRPMSGSIIIEVK
jgi:hypothetical protein